MAGNEPGARPRSPHLQVYKWTPAMAVSIFHRVSGDGLAIVGAGMFLWCDLSSLLDEKSWAAEARLYDQLRTDLRVVLTPGEAQHAAAPGWFRICYAFVGRDVLDAALETFQAWVERRRA